MLSMWRWSITFIVTFLFLLVVYRAFVGSPEDSPAKTPVSTDVSSISDPSRETDFMPESIPFPSEAAVGQSGPEGSLVLPSRNRKDLEKLKRGPEELKGELNAAVSDVLRQLEQTTSLRTSGVLAGLAALTQLAKDESFNEAMQSLIDTGELDIDSVETLTALMEAGQEAGETRMAEILPAGIPDVDVLQNLPNGMFAIDVEQESSFAESPPMLPMQEKDVKVPDEAAQEQNRIQY